jgi:plasmid maintenance system antidote protein VapI/Zn-dependent peptidase ImmA (M78 family)
MSDILGEKGLSVGELAELLGHTLERTQDLLQGRATITIRTARALQTALGGSVEFWISRDYQYRAQAARIHAVDEEWLGELPLGDMIRFGWLQPPPRPSEEVEACLRFFGTPSVAAWRHAYDDLDALVAFRTSPTLDSRPAAVAAWIRKGEIECAKIECAPWSATGFTGSLQHIRRLTLEKDPRHFLPVLQEICSACGVAVVIVRAPNGCRASGATRFVSKDRALLLLSFRYLSDDQFWFTFFHEAGHLLLHSPESTFLEGLDTESSAQESEASEFAENVLIPTESKEALLRLGPTDTRTIIRFARRIGISPGIVVGQLQHHGKVRRNHFNGLKRRFQWGVA